MANGAPSSAGAAARNARLPPSSEEAERGVLGSALLDGARVVDLCIQRQIDENSFYEPAHRTVYAAMLALNEGRQPIDLLTVTNRLRDEGLLEKVGGSVALDRLVDATPTSAHAEYYIDIVRQKHLLRRVIDQARRAEGLCFDPDRAADEVLADIEQSFFDISSSRRVDMRPWSGIIKDVIVLIDKIATTNKGISGIPTGYINIDKVLGGLRPNQLIVLAARPSMGKTSLAMNIAENIVTGVADPGNTKRPVGIFSLEMSCEDLAMRMICSRARVTSQSLWNGFISKDTTSHRRLVDAANLLFNAPLFIDDSAALDIAELRARARRMKAKHDVQLIVIDYLQMLSCAAKGRDGRQVEVAAVSGQLKAMAKELKIPVLVLSQLSRAPEGRDEGEPKLSDLRDSGAIEQDADIVLLLRRPCRIRESKEHDDQLLAIIDIAKNRNGQTIDGVQMNFEADFTLFRDRAALDESVAAPTIPDEGGAQ